MLLCVIDNLIKYVRESANKTNNLLAEHIKIRVASDPQYTSISIAILSMVFNDISESLNNKKRLYLAVFCLILAFLCGVVFDIFLRVNQGIGYFLNSGSIFLS